MVDRSYRENPKKFSKDLTKKLERDAEEKFEEWESKGRLPKGMRLKNLFSKRQVKLRDKRD